MPKRMQLAAEKRTVAGHINNGSMDLGMMRVEQVRVGVSLQQLGSVPLCMGDISAKW